MLLNPEVDTSRCGPSPEQLPQSTGLSRTQGSAGLARETGGELCLPAQGRAGSEVAVDLAEWSV